MCACSRHYSPHGPCTCSCPDHDWLKPAFNAKEVHKAPIPSPTLETVDILLEQIERDKKTPYWGEPPHNRSLAGAESWLRSLRDWLEA